MGKFKAESEKKGKLMNFRFTKGIAPSAEKLAKMNGQSMTAYIEQLIRKDAKERNFELFETDDPEQG